jgi:two-component system, NarL family, nitrate/nitrite response regulator NarL
MTDSCRTTLIEPNQLFREGLKHLLAGTRFDVSSEFSTMEAAVKGGSSGASPDLLIMGLSNSEIRDLRPLREAYPASRIIVLADQLTVDSLREAMAAGIDGFLIKDVSPEALVQSLRLILLGEKVFPTNLASMLIEMNSPTAHSGTGPFRGLSPREQEILQALVTGASNKLIANRLGITEATVKVHLKTLLRKIDVNNRTQAAIWALNHGITANPANDLRAVSA